MEEKHGNVEKMFEPIKENEPRHRIHFYLNWQCSKCGIKYGTQPSHCHGCGCNHLFQIKPEYQSLMGKNCT
jgi:hypothetical protein